MNRSVQKIKPKHKKLMKNIIAGKDKTTAYMELYPESTKQASYTSVNRILTKPENQSYMIELLNNNNNSDIELIEELNKLKNAYNYLSFQGKLTGDKMPDNKVRLQVLNTLLKLKGHLQNDNVTAIDNRSINYNIEPEDTDKLLKIAERLDRLNDKLLSK
jgi:hypothetical protein